MAIKVKTQYLGHFNMPRHCVACGGAPGLKTKTASASKSDWSGKRTTSLRLEFPLCQECAEVGKDTRFAIAIRLLGVLVSVPLCLLFTFMGSSIGQGAAVLGGVVLSLAVFLVAVWVSSLVNTRGMTPEQRERRRLVNRSVKIAGFRAPGLFSKGWILFKFENDAFGNEFSALNMGDIDLAMAGRRGISRGRLLAVLSAIALLSIAAAIVLVMRDQNASSTGASRTRQATVAATPTTRLKPTPKSPTSTRARPTTVSDSAQSGCPPGVTFVQDVTVPDGTQFSPGESFTKVWRVRSSGCSAWEAGSRWVFVSGHPLGAADGVDVPDMPLGETVDLSVAMRAPDQPGSYKSYWQMQSPDGHRFGDQAYALIVVPGQAAAPDTRPTVSIVIVNNTGGTLVLNLDGPAQYTFTLEPGSHTVQVVPGEYTYSGRACGGRFTGKSPRTISEQTTEWSWKCD